jgi:hypothetical protein
MLKTENKIVHEFQQLKLDKTKKKKFSYNFFLVEGVYTHVCPYKYIFHKYHTIVTLLEMKLFACLLNQIQFIDNFYFNIDN